MTQCDKSAGATRLLRSDTLGRVSYTAEQREAALEAFDSSCLSGPEFARVHGIKYQTFASWRQRRRREASAGGDGQSREQSITLIEATLPEPAPACGLRIDLPGGAVMTVPDHGSVGLACALLAGIRDLQAEGARC